MKLRVSKKDFKHLFPHLLDEIEEGQMSLPIHSIRQDSEQAEEVASESLMGYNPDVVDFLRRCETEEEASEIIDYMERRGEISHGYATKLRKQLKSQGVRSFGSKKEPDYYMRRGKLT